MKQSPHLFSLLAFYAERYIGQLLDHSLPPYEVADMTTYRLESPLTLEEVIKGVLTDEHFQQEWGHWRGRLHQIQQEAIPCWVAGQTAYHQFRHNHSDFDEQTMTDRGMSMARMAFQQDTSQMWFYEGWLAAGQEREG